MPKGSQFNRKNKINLRKNSENLKGHMSGSRVGQKLPAGAKVMKDFIDSIDNGWQPFQVRKSHEPKPQNAVMCPSSKEANRVSSCEACKLCDGSKYLYQ